MGACSTDTGDPYLYWFPDTYSNVYRRPVVDNYIPGRYLNAYNAIEQHRNMRKYDLGLDKYWVTQSGYYRHETTVSLGTGIKYATIIFCHGISVKNRDKEISIIDQNDGKVYNCFKNIFEFDCGIQNFNLNLMPIDDRPRPPKHSIILLIRHQLKLMLPDFFIINFISPCD